MYTVIGTVGCGKCLQVKKILENKNIEFEYKLFLSLDEKEQGRIWKIAEENKIDSFPIIFNDNGNLINMENI